MIYYVRNRALTPAEYEAEVMLDWCVRVFVVVAVGLGVVMWRWVVDPTWPKAIRYVCIVGLPIAVACWAVRYTFVIRVCTYLVLFVGAIICVLAFLWHAI